MKYIKQIGLCILRELWFVFKSLVKSILVVAFYALLLYLRGLWYKYQGYETHIESVSVEHLIKVAFLVYCFARYSVVINFSEDKEE